MKTLPVRQVVFTPPGGRVYSAGFKVSDRTVLIRRAGQPVLRAPAEPYFLERLAGMSPEVIASLKLEQKAEDVDAVLRATAFRVQETAFGWLKVTAGGRSILLPTDQLHRYPISVALRSAIESAAPLLRWPDANTFTDFSGAPGPRRASRRTHDKAAVLQATELKSKQVDLRELGVLKTRGGQQLISDPTTGKAIVVLTDHESKQMYMVESSHQRHVGEAQIARRVPITKPREAGKEPVIVGWRVGLFGGNFGSSSALESTARHTAAVITQKQADEGQGRDRIILERPRGEIPGPTSFTERVAALLGASLPSAELKVEEPKPRTAVEIERARSARQEEDDRYAHGTPVQDLKELAGNIIEAGFNASALPKEAFEGTRIIVLPPATRDAGERLLRAGMPGDYVYVTLEPGVVGQPVIDAPGFRMPSYTQVGATAIVRRGPTPSEGGVEMTRNADVWNGSNSPIKLLMIPAAAYLEHWHKPFSEKEFGEAARSKRRYISIADSVQGVRRDFVQIKNELDAADPAHANFAQISDRLGVLSEETDYLLKQLELLPPSTSNRQATTRMDVVRKQIAAASEFLEQFSAADGAASVARLEEILAPEVKGMSSDALMRVLRILLGRHSAVDSVGAPNEAHLATVNDGVLMHLFDLFGQLRQDQFDFWSQTTLFTDFKAKGRTASELGEMETATVISADGTPLSNAGEIWSHIQRHAAEWTLNNKDQFNIWTVPHLADQLFGVLVHGIYSFDVVRQAIEPKYGLTKAKEVYEGVVMHHLTNSFISYLFNMAGLEVDFHANAPFFPPGRAKACEDVHKAALRLTKKMKPEIAKAASRPADQPPAVEQAIRDQWATDPDANIVREYLKAAPNTQDEDHLIARLQSIFDDVQQMTLLGLPKWIDIAYNTNPKGLKTNRDLVVALARGQVQEYGETNLMRGFGPMYVDASVNSLSVIGIEHIDRHPSDPRYSYYFQLAPEGTTAHATFAKTIASDPTLRGAFGKEISTRISPREQRELVDWFLSQPVNPTDLKRLVENVAA